MDPIDVLIIGAGPAGLRAAQVLADGGREVVVAEKHAEIGPKTCAGGLTRKTVALLRPLGLPDDCGLERVGQVAFNGRSCVLHPERTMVRTVPRRELGRYQLQWARAAGADVRPGSPVTGIDLARRTACIAGQPVRWRHLIGADGTDSAVRRALGVPSPRECFAAEYNVPRVRLEPLRIEVDPGLAGGYFWVFPHCDYTSIGAVASKRKIRPAALRRYLDRRIAALGVPAGAAPFEAATIEVEFQGLHFPGDVHLAGDAAGVASALTAEGIYAALLTGEEVARGILSPAYQPARTRHWLGVKRRHDRLERTLQFGPARAAVLPALARVARWQRTRRTLADWFLAG
ncbi:MAG TPA: NAD(P)/FAD-dependent oxidoreductase [Gemmatimonadales bacterium]|nr:NAD(P)/FAD-dependent oxidoreductase [Gemmatimonadales bacterium]